jgi:hypothetical protein
VRREEQMTERNYHHVTYARDPCTGRYVVKVTGPHAAYFEGRRVLVSLNSGDSRDEYLEECLSWTIDEQEDQVVAYYAFITRISDLDADIPLFNEEGRDD